MRMSKGCAAASALAFGLAACGAPPQGEVQRQQTAEDYAASFGIDADVSTNADGSESVEVRTASGAIAGNNLALPADFPGDIPIYPDLNISSVNNVGQTRMIQGIAEDSVEEIATFYLAQMAGEGWTASADQQPAPTMRMLQFTKAGRTVGINLMQNGPGAAVSLTTMGG